MITYEFIHAHLQYFYPTTLKTKMKKNTKLHASKRTYFFFYENSESKGLLEIIESKKGKNGKIIRNKIMVFQKDIPDFLEKLKAVSEKK